MTQSARPARPAWARALRAALIVIVFLAAGALFGYLIGGALRGDAPRGQGLQLGEVLTLIVALPCVLFLVLLAHELGHVLGGALVGFRFWLLIVGPLKVSRLGGRLRPGLNRSLGLYGGLAATAPEDDRDLPRRMAVMVAGGPAASLLLAALGLGLAALLRGWPAGLALGLGGASLMIALATLLPLRSGGFYSDGARLLMLLRGGPAARRWAAAAALSSAYLNNRPRDLSPALVARTAELSDGSLDSVGAALVRYAWALDRGDIAAAGAAIDVVAANVASYPAPLRPSLLLEAAYFAGRHRGDPAAARRLLDQARGGAMVETYTRRRAEAAVLLAEGRRDEGLAAARQGLDAIRRADQTPQVAFETELLADLLAQ